MQIGGTHYQAFVIQPIDFIRANHLDFCTGSVIKYVMRHKHKNGREDLEKARHYIDLLIEQEYPEQLTTDPYAALKKAHELGEVIEVLWTADIPKNKWTVLISPDWSMPPERYRIRHVTDALT